MPAGVGFAGTAYRIVCKGGKPCPVTVLKIAAELAEYCDATWLKEQKGAE